MKTPIRHVLLAMAVISPMMAAAGKAETRHVWEKVEIALQSQRPLGNPYTDVQVWVDLKGPGLDRRCYGFWDGGSTFRVRVLATAPGRWTWESCTSNETAPRRNCRVGPLARRITSSGLIRA